jgi:ankyrin repeat protein
LIERESGALEHAPVKPTGAVIALLTRDDGTLVDALDHAGYTALHVAAAAADADAVAALCAAGARYDLQAVNDDEGDEKGLFHFCRARNLRYLWM